MKKFNLILLFSIVIVTDSFAISSLDKQAWSRYIIDECEGTKAEDIGYRKCSDGSVSFVQPPARGVGGWEGKCGQTFGSNALYSLCKRKVDPSTYFRGYLRDITPGVRPGVLKRGLNRVFSNESEQCPSSLGSWHYFATKSASSYINLIQELNQPKFSHPSLISISRNGQSYFRNPVGILIQNPGGRYLHWVSVIDMLREGNSCEMVINHWDNQYQVPCDVVSDWSRDVGQSYPIILKSFSIVSFK